MSVNLAIVIAVSDYQSPTDPLPACKQDAIVIGTILRESKRFDEILELTENAIATHVKTQLSEFISRHESSDVGELVFYFSGHGQFDGNEFFFLLEDYDRRRPAQTSLTNDDLDEMLRSLSPNLAVKFVDACQSGVSYVKDSESLGGHIRKTVKTYKNCYFMFSSNSDQYSWADHELSAFTREVATAVRNHEGDSIRYKDVMDYVSDAFQNRGKQSPFFVTQANHTDVFVNISPSLRSSLSDLVPDGHGSAVVTLSDGPEEHPLLKAVRAESNKYASKAAGLAAISAFGDELEAAELSEPLPLLYERETRLTKDDFYPAGKSLAKWLTKRTDNILAKVEYTTENITSREKKYRRDRFNFTFGLDDYEYVDVSKQVSVPYRITVTAETPFTVAHIELTPRFAALPRQSAFVVVCFSKRDFFAFYTRVRLKETDWEDYTMPMDAEWKSQSCLLSDETAMRRTARDILERLSDEIIRDIQKAHLPAPKDSA